MLAERIKNKEFLEVVKREIHAEIQGVCHSPTKW